MKIIDILQKEVKNYKVPVITMISRNQGKPFKILISTVLSLRTKDEVTLEATSRLWKKARTPSGLINLGEDKIQKIIYPVGFYKTKAKNIIKICKILKKKYKGKVPSNMDQLLKLPNVGRKTANIVLSLGYNKYEGIAIDTHCHRIPNRIGIIKTKTPKETEKALIEIVPKSYWKKFNEIFVAFGQGRCYPINPKCDNCPILNYCEFGQKRAN